MINTVANKYLFGKGKVSLCERDTTTGAVERVLYLGNCPDLKLTPTSETVPHFESTSGRNVQDRSVVKTVGLEVAVTLESISEDNLAILLWGSKISMASASGQSYFLPVSDAVAGDKFIIPNAFNLSSVVVKDSAGTPATLVPDTDYKVDTDFGVIEIIDPSGFTQPFEIEYNRGTAKNVPFMTTDRPVRFLRFEGVNLGNPGAAQTKVLVEVYNVALSPVNDISFIGDDFAKFELKGEAQMDETRQDDSNFGGFGRMLYL